MPRKCRVLPTAHALQEYRDRCVSAGCSGYLSKPVRMRALLEAVAAALGDAGDTATRPMKIDAE